ncbi:hypothetical protein Emed_001828 [Eimeria media]
MGESLAAAASQICETLRPQRALLLLQQGSSLKTLQHFMRKRDLQVDLLSEVEWWKAEQAQEGGEAEQNKSQLLAETMDSARGLDVEGADLVLMLGRVRSAAEYQHLAGRVGRCGRRGVAVVVSDAVNHRVVLGWRRTLGIDFADLSKSSDPGSLSVNLDATPSSELPASSLLWSDMPTMQADERQCGHAATDELEGLGHQQLEKAAHASHERLIGAPATSLHLQMPSQTTLLQHETEKEPIETTSADMSFLSVELPSLLLMQGA